MSPALLELFWRACVETVVMVAAAGAAALLFGLPLGVILAVTDRGGLLPLVPANRLLGAAINAVRSLPFIILLVTVIPLTRLLVGTSIGTPAAIVPLSLAAIPFFARLVESSLREIAPGLVEAAQAMGAHPGQTVREVLLPEARPGLIRGFTVTLVSLIGTSAMAGVVGGGGLGDLAVRFGLQRFNPTVVAAVVVVLIVLVGLVQWAGDALARRLDRRP